MRKLVLLGPANGGKTAYSYIIKGFIRDKFIARITQEAIFGCQQLKAWSLLMEMDDWGNCNLATDIIKTMLQGNFILNQNVHTQHLFILIFSSLD